jgi:hypothetical protein
VQVELVDEIIPDQRVEELAAAVERDVLAGSRLQPANCAHRVVADDRRVAPIGRSSVFDTTYFAGAFIMSPNTSPGGIGSNASACGGTGGNAWLFPLPA